MIGEKKIFNFLSSSLPEVMWGWVGGCKRAGAGVRLIVVVFIHIAFRCDCDCNCIFFLLFIHLILLCFYFN